MYFFSQAAPVDQEKVENTLKFLSKAYETYKDFDDAKEEQEKRLMDAFDRIPLNRVSGADPVRSHFTI